ncbi:MAG: hypothetical protein E7048_08190 [Lentisphaerae bacterium]|nr:hypothetical protein [Lentisphaerota bacterium]
MRTGSLFAAAPAAGALGAAGAAAGAAGALGAALGAALAEPFFPAAAALGAAAFFLAVTVLAVFAFPFAFLASLLLVSFAAPQRSSEHIRNRTSRIFIIFYIFPGNCL